MIKLDFSERKYGKITFGKRMVLWRKLIKLVRSSVHVYVHVCACVCESVYICVYVSYRVKYVFLNTFAGSFNVMLTQAIDN